MSRVKEASKIQVGGEQTFIENAASQGFIGPFKWDIGELYETHVMKIATRDEEYVMGELPSWVFFEDYTGLKAMITEIGKSVGDYTYDVKKSVFENIVGALRSKGLTIMAKSILAGKELKDACAVEGATLETIQEVLEKDFNAEKMRFIKTRTQIRMALGTAVATKVGDEFKSGSIDPVEIDPEPTRLAERLFSLSIAMTRAAFEQETGLTDRASTDYDNKWGKYRFQKAPMQAPQVKSIAFARTGQVTYADSVGWVYIADKRSKKETDTKYLDVTSNEKFQKLQNRRHSPNTDTELDYVPLRYEYTSGNNKTDAGRLFTIVTHDGRIPENEIYDSFRVALPEHSYNKCYALQEYPIEEVAATMTQWINDNKGLIDLMPGEDTDRLAGIIEEIGLDGITTDAVADMVGDVMAQHNLAQAEAPVAEQPVVEQPVQPQEPVYEQQAQPVDPAMGLIPGADIGVPQVEQQVQPQTEVNNPTGQDMPL